MRLSKPFVAAMAAISASVLLAGCGSHDAETPDAKSDIPAPKLVKVGGATGVQMDPGSIKLAGITMVTAGENSLSPSTMPTGEVTPTDSSTVQVTARLPGKITEARVSVGDRVHKGEIIAEVDSVDLAAAEAAYQTAVSHAELSRNQLAQQKKLAGYGSLSEQPVEDARKASVASDAAVSSDEAQIRVDRLALTSTQQLVEMGEITRKPTEDAQNAYAQAQSAASQAAATLHSTKANLDRASILFKGGVFSRQQLEDAETAYNSAVASDAQSKIAEQLARQELTRQETIFNKNLNGAGALQGAQSKLQQDEHTYSNDLVAQTLAHRQYQRAVIVRKSGIPVSQALQAAQDTYDEAKIAVQGAATTLQLYGVKPGEQILNAGRVVIPIVSPIDGIVAARSMVIGQNTDTATPLARLVNLDKVYIDAQIYEKDIQGVSAGDRVTVRVAAFPNRTFTGKVQLVADEVSTDSRTVLVRTVLENPGWTLRPGMFASVTIGSGRSVRALSVPSDAVIQEDDKQVVYVQTSPGQFVKRVITTQPSIGGKTPIVSGLREGDQVVVAGNVLIEKAQEQLENGKSGSL